MAETDYTPIVPQGVRVAEAAARVLRVVEERGTPDQVARLRQSFEGATPPKANTPQGVLFMAEALATTTEMVEGLIKEREPKHAGGRPRKSRRDEGDTP